MDEKEMVPMQEKRPVGRPKGSKDTHPRPGRPDRSWKGNETLQPGDNARYLQQNLVIAQWPQIDTADPEQVQERITQYFQHCLENDMKPGVAGMSLALGVDRRTFYSWSVGASRQRTHTAIIQHAKQTLESLWETYMLNGRINPVSAIFIAKNHFGYRDQSELVLSPPTAANDDGLTPAELEAKYLADVAGSGYEKE